MAQSDATTNDNGREIMEMDRAHNLHPWTHFDSFKTEGAMVISEGKGTRVKDANGQEYLDAVGGLWCTNIGLGRDEMADAIADQVRKLAFSNTFVEMTNEPAARLSKKLAEIAPTGINHVHFTTGGSTAVDSAYRMVQFYHTCAGNPEKIHVIAREQAYHGSTYASISIGKKAMDRVPEFRFIEDTIHHVSSPDKYRAPNGMSEAEFGDYLIKEFEDKIAEIGADKVGAFFAEPLMGAGGVLVAPDGYLKRMWEVCQRHGILFVADEVVTAFGRLGHWFASEDEFGVVPDMITTAKGLSSGYLPIGALLYSDHVHEVISTGDPYRWFTSGYTYAGHPVSCAAALKNIEIFERENLLERAKEIGTYFETRLHELEDMQIVGDVRGCKLMMCVENVMNKDTKELFPPSMNIGGLIADACQDMGLIVRPINHLNVMSPPLIITRDEVDFIVETLRKGIQQVTDKLIEDGVI